MRSSTPRRLISSLLLIGLATATACGDGDGENEGEVITTVILTFTPEPSGSAVTAVFNDPDGDGGTAPTVDPVALAAARTYTLAVGFENRLETPAEVITTEVADEAAEHQIFLTGTAVAGPATMQTAAPLLHTYKDMDANGLPIGLSNTIVTAAGTGQLTVTLRHVPPVNNVAVKTAGLAAQVKASGLTALPGSSDASVTFMVTVQ